MSLGIHPIVNGLIQYSDMTGTVRVPESKGHGANMGSIWGRQDPGGPHVDPMDFAM